MNLNDFLEDKQIIGKDNWDSFIKMKEKLQKESDKLEIPLSELCRFKLQNSLPLTKTRFLLEKLLKELNDVQNSGKRSSEFCY